MADPLSMAGLNELVTSVGVMKRRELWCHPSVLRALQDAAWREDEITYPGRMGDLMGIPILVDEDAAPGAWRLMVNGELEAEGTLGHASGPAPAETGPPQP